MTIPGACVAAAHAAAGGVTDESPRLVRAGSALMYRAGGYAIRVEYPQTDAGHLTRMVEVTRWLTGQVPVPEVVAHGVFYGCQTLTSPWIGSAGAVTVEDTARAAATLSGLTAPNWMPPFDPLTGTRARLRDLAAAAGRPDVVTRLNELLTEAHDVAETYGATGPAGVVHGDLTTTNLIAGTDGRVWMIDWESAGAGSSVWDAGRAYQLAHRYGNGNDWGTYRCAYTAAGGVLPDVCDLRAVAAVFDLVAGVWAAHCALTSPTVYAAEARKRVATLLGEDTAAPWSGM